MPIDQRPRAIFLMGPTASGKTALALELAERFGCALISVDSALVYRGLDIGSAKPDAATRTRHPHRLIDIRDPAQAYSAAEFRADALREMTDIVTHGRVPLLAGGTGLYFRALQYGLSNLPEADAGLRERMSREAETAVTVSDRSTLVISGLRMIRTTTREEKIPGLGDVPVLGWLFKNHRSQQEQTDLYFFITPTML